MLDREIVIWEIRQALKTINEAQRARFLSFDFMVLDPTQQMQIVLALNHAIGVRDETN